MLHPTYVQIHAHILRAEVLHADETRWMLLQKGGSKQRQAWALSTEESVFYHIDSSRGAAVPIELLKGYKGGVMADGLRQLQDAGRLLSGRR